MPMIPVFATTHNLAQLNKAINSDLKQLETWLKGNKLSLNVMKTSSMLITTIQKYKVLKMGMKA